jgi:hypothetical protein
MLVGHCRSAGIRHPLTRRLQCQVHGCKPLCIKNFHVVAAGNAHKYSLKTRIGRVSPLILQAEHQADMLAEKAYFSGRTSL